MLKHKECSNSAPYLLSWNPLFDKKHLFLPHKKEKVILLDSTVKQVVIDTSLLFSINLFFFCLLEMWWNVFVTFWNPISKFCQTSIWPESRLENLTTWIDTTEAQCLLWTKKKKTLRDVTIFMKPPDKPTILFADTLRIRSFCSRQETSGIFTPCVCRSTPCLLNCSSF